MTVKFSGTLIVDVVADDREEARLLLREITRSITRIRVPIRGPVKAKVDYADLVEVKAIR
jgi:hypothetical protein